MKQVIVRIRDVDGKLRAKEYFTSVSQFESFAQGYIAERLESGYEVQIKVGNNYSAFRTYEGLLDDARYNLTDIDSEIYSLVQNCISYVKDYLPRY